MRRTVCVVSLAAFAGSLAGPALAQAPTGLEADAIAFGVRESVSGMDLSPDGKQAVFVGPGPGRSSVVYMADLVAGTTKPQQWERRALRRAPRTTRSSPRS